jgi:hypothetical protein
MQSSHVASVFSFFLLSFFFGVFLLSCNIFLLFLSLTYQGKDIVFRLIIEYSSLRDFGPYVIIIGLFLYEDFLKMIFWLKLEISYRIIISWRFLVSFRGFFEDNIFARWNIWVSIFGLKIIFNVNGKVTVWHTPCLICGGVDFPLCQPDMRFAFATLSDFFC